MGLYTTLFMAFGLSMDAFAVSVADGSRAPRLRRWRALSLALTFGLFQALMPLIGWAVGVGLKDLVSSADHWVAFGLLGLVGGKMIHADLRGKAEAEAERPSTAGVTTLLVVAVATSIDALAVGFSLALFESVLLPVLAIGPVTFSACFAGVHLGHRYSRLGRARTRRSAGRSWSRSASRSSSST